LRKEIRAAVDQLSPIQQLALRLTRLQGLSTAEAAAVSGHSVGGLKIAAHRAVRVLRARLAVAPA
jgi:RNA polymerase sigma-70 factor (ECF subfamily)